MRGHFIALVVFALAAPVARGGEEAARGPLPQGMTGLASKLVMDARIETAPGVVFHDGFESGDLGKWNSGYAQKRFSRIARQEGNFHSGSCALEWEVAPGKDTGGNVGYRFRKGHETLFLRWYMKFASDFDQGNLTHTGAGLAGCAPGHSVPGGAGIRPNGRDKYCTALDPWRNWGRNRSPGELILYTYHPDQKGRWGDNLKPKQAFIPSLGKWHCFEIMLQANTVNKKDGRVAIWADGRLLEEFPGLRLRDVESLVPNKVWLVCYMHDSKKTNKAWFDDVVAATAYIGPMAKEAPKPKAKPAVTAARGPEVTGEDEKKSVAEQEAGRLFAMARQAERMGQRSVAKSLYAQIVEKFPETGVAKRAKAKLD